MPFYITPVNIKKQMKLSENALTAIKDKSGLRLRNLIALELNIHFSSLERWLSENRADGPLTRASILKLITEETGLTQEEILTEEKLAS